MFFQLHDEKKIGYKALTNADLGRKETSHQTHIGLFDDVFTFFPNSKEVTDAMLIYENQVEFLSVNFDRIQNPNNTFRSPKIKTGGTNVVSVVSYIRDRAKEKDSEMIWYLFWFGLKSEQPVFFLFNESSSAYTDICNMGLALNEKVKGRLQKSHPAFSLVLSYLETIVNSCNEKNLQELELTVQTQEKNTRFRKYDINQAQELYTKIGKEGERLIDQYFENQLAKNLISNYNWMNKEKECGLPYDFYIETLDAEIIYLDVKTTLYNFSQKMIFSNQEIEFATGCANKYWIFRVYQDTDKNYCLRVCNNVKILFEKILNITEEFKNILITLAQIETMKMAIFPLNDDLVFGEKIFL